VISGTVAAAAKYIHESGEAGPDALRRRRPQEHVKPVLTRDRFVELKNTIT
jgi:hypothetical protein